MCLVMAVLAIVLTSSLARAHPQGQIHIHTDELQQIQSSDTGTPDADAALDEALVDNSPLPGEAATAVPVPMVVWAGVVIVLGTPLGRLARRRRSRNDLAE